MSELNLIKTVLFNAVNLQDALTRLTELGITYRESDTVDMWFIDSENVQFWPSRSARCPLTVCINNLFIDYDDRLSFLAGQCETVETTVPAASPETTGQRPIYLNVGFDSKGNLTQKLIYPKVDQIRSMVRTERRLKHSQAKGLSS